MAGQAGLDGGGFADNSNAFEGFNVSSNQRVWNNLMRRMQRSQVPTQDTKITPRSNK